MKINNKFLICAMLVFVLFLCINAGSAAEPLNDDLAISDVSNDPLSVSDDTLSVNENGDGDYGISSVAVDDASGGEKISTKNADNDSEVKDTLAGWNAGETGELTNVVTNDTFYSYFDEDGFLRDSITFEELTFNGTFSDVSDYIVLNKAITIKGDNALLNNIAFVIDSEDVELNGLTLVATGSLGNLINVGASNVNLYNLNMTYIVDDEMANAISVSARGTLSDINIVNNTIYFESHIKNDEELTTAINLEDVEDVIVDNNDIAVSFPGLYVGTYDYTYFMMGLCYVNPVRLYETRGVNLTNNKVGVKVNSYDASYPTIQALYIVGSYDVLVKGNNITMKDNITPSGTAIYLYAVECGFSEDIAFVDNKFDISTTGGQSGAGSAYALQIATTSSEIIGNTIICDSNGPNLGIYSPYGFGPAKDLVIKDNFINVTGYAAGTGDFALISGIEIQTGYATIYNNTIYSMNKGDYNERYPVTAVSAVQYSASTLSFDIKDNDIYTNGKYAVDILYKVNDAYVTGNYLSANILKGDDAAYIKSGTGNVIEGNYPTIGVVTNDTFFNFFDDAGVLIDNRDYYGLIFEGNFSDLVDTIVFNKAFKVYGNNTVLDNIAVRIEADNVELSGFTINANKQFADNNDAVIYATGSDIKLDDVVVNYTAPSEVEAIAIYANAADNFVLSNSEIMYVATNPGDKHNYGLEVRTSNNVLIENNKIDATLPAVDVDYGASGIDMDLVLAVGIQGGENVSFTSNVVNVNTNGGIGSYPTIDAVLIRDVDNVLINFNNITHIDLTSQDVARYYYSIDLYGLTGTVENNNILLNTTSGIERSGSAYPIQLTGPFTLVINNNNLTSISKGPNAGIYASNWGGPADLTATNNFINVTGYAAEHNWALVTAIEPQIDVARIYNNTIYTYNIADYGDANQIYGVSFSQWGTGGSYDVTGNIINTEGKYTVYFKEAENTNVTYNTLYAHNLTGDDSVLIASGENNTVENNQPPYHFDVIVDVNGTWVGYDNIVKVTVTNATGALATGSVQFKINNVVLSTVTLIDGEAILIIPAKLLVVGENEVVAQYESNNSLYRGSEGSAKFQVVDGVVTQDNYFVYFNQADNGKFFDYVPEGVTLDFQGSIINPDQANTVQMNVNKPVNIISTTGDAYVDLNTTAGSLLGESPGNSFAVTNGGSGSNVTGIFFHNTQIWISNTSNVVLDNISVVVEDQRVGSGVGATTIRDNSSNVVLKNSYLYTRNNGGSTTFTMSWTTNCTIDNCTVKAEGNVGNLIYLNVYNIVGAPSGVPLNNNNTVSNNRIYGKEGSGISVGLMVEGTGNLIVNNTLYKSSISTSFGGQKPANNIYVGNVLTQNGGLTAQANSIVYGNNVTGALSTGAGSVAHDNIVGGKMTVGADAVAYNNAVGNGLTTGGTNAVIENNIIVGAVTINKVGTTFVGNDVNGTVTVSSNNNVIKGNDIITTANYAVDLGAKTGNNVTDNYLVASVYKGDAAVKFTNVNNVVENNNPKVDITVAADAVWMGSNGTVIVTVVDGTGNVTIKVNNKTYTAELDNGVATKVIPVEDLVAGANDVTVTYESAAFLPATVDTVLAVLDGVITNATYENYFDASGNLVDGVPDGVTLDFQGLFLGKYPVYIDKNVNVISSTGDALFDAGATYAGNAINSFNIVAGGDNTNITGLDFINYCLYIKGASNVTVDDISIVANKRGVGSGTGFLSIHTGAYNTLVKNSYFENGGTGSSLLVLGKGGAYAVFDHNVFNITGSSGNILSANQFVGTGNAPEHVSYTNNVLYNSQPGSAFCYAMTVSGSGNLVENNTIYHNGSGILNQYGASSTGNVYRNNTLYGNTNFNPSANSIVENNKIYATTNIAANTTVVGNTFQNVAISGTNTTFANNDVSGTVTVSGNGNAITENTVLTTGDYAVDLKSTANNIVTDNYLVASLYNGDLAVNYVDESNIVENNGPLADVSVTADSVWVGSNGAVIVNVVNGAGNVTVKVNNKEYIVELDENGTATAYIPAEDLVAGENNVSATYESVEYPITTVDTILVVIDGVVTQDNYFNYFNQADNGRLFDYVPEGATLDFQGSIINPDQKITVQMNVNKPVNIISTTGDAYVDLNTTAGSLLGESPGNSFAVTNGGSGSNVTGIFFHNTQIWISNTSNVVLDNISVVVEDQRVGSGVGATTIRDNSSNVVLKNSYLYTRNNGGSTTFTMSWTTNCTIDNCTVKAEGNVGNLIYLNVYNIVGAPSGVPLNNNNTVSNNRIYGKEGSGISVGLMVEGTGNLIVNNTLYKSSISTSFGGQKPANNIYVGNVLTQNGGLTAQANSIVYGNNVTGALSTGAGSVAHDNIVGGKMTVGADAVAYNNAVGNGLTTGGTNAVIENNIIVGAVTINKVGTTFVGNDVNGTVTVSSNNNVIKGNDIITTANYAVDLGAKTGNNVTDNYLVASVYKGDAAVKFTNVNNVVENNNPKVDITVAADAVWMGSNGTVIVTVVDGTGNVTIKVNNKTYTAELDNGVATKVIPVEDLVAGANDVTVTYESAAFLPATVDTVLAVLDGVITNATYENYFDASGNLVDGVPDGVTLDFQGLFLGKYPVYIDKNVNVISSTGDALFDAGATYAGNAINSFNIVAGGDNTNITGLDFINYCLYIKGASNVTVDDISIVANKRGVGSGTGFLSIHTGAYNTLVKNSYFENGGTGSSLLVLGKGGAYAVFDHNVFNITGSSGNILSANQFVGTGNAPEHVSYTNNVLYNSQPGSAFCYAMTVSGSGNLVENNTIYHNGSGILNQYGASSTGNVYRNNTLYGNTNFNPSANSIVENNKIYATTNIAANTTVVGNTFQNVAISGTNTTFANNDVSGTVTVKGNENTIVDNIITSSGDYAVDLQSTANNIVTENVLNANELVSDDAVKYTDESNVVQHNYPLRPVLIVEAENIKVGEDAIIDISFNESVNGVVDVIVDGEPYTVVVTDGNGQLIVSGLVANDYTVNVTFEGDLLFIATENSTTFTVEKYDSELNVTVGENNTSIDVVLSEDATGRVLVDVDGVGYYAELINGAATITLPELSPGEHNVTVNYLGDDKYGNFTINQTVTAPKLTLDTNTTIVATVDKFDVTIVVNVNASSIVNDGIIKLTFNGKTELAEVVNGVATFKFNNLDANKYNITADYMGTKLFDPSSANSSVKVVRLQAYVAPVYKMFVFNYGHIYKFTLKDRNGNPIAGRTVLLYIHGKIYSTKTNSKGEGQFKLTPEILVYAGQMKTRVLFKGDSQYKAHSKPVYITALKEDTKLVSVKSGSYKLSDNNKVVTATLKDSKNKVMKNKEVSLDINGKTVKAKTDAKGVVTFKLNNVNFAKAGKYSFTVTFKEDKFYKQSKAKGTLTITS